MILRTIYLHSFVSIVLLGFSTTHTIAQDIITDELETQLQQMEIEIKTQEKALDQQVKQLNQQVDQQVKLNLKQMKKELAQLDKISNLQIPPVPPIPPISVPNIMDPEKMIQEFKGEVARIKSTELIELQTETMLTIDSKFTSIHITPADGRTMTVEITKLGGSKTKPDAEKIANRYQIKTTQDKNEVSIEIDLDGNDENNNGKTLMHCFLTISLPTGTPIEVANEFGGVRYENLEGDIESTNKFGSTVILNTKGELDLNTSYGSLNIDGHHGSSDINSEFGDATIINLHGETDFNNSYGNSNISFSNPNTNADISLSFGNGTIRLPKTFDGGIDGSSSFGNLIMAGNKIMGNLHGEVRGTGESSGVTLSFKSKKDMFSQSIECSTGDGDGDIDIEASYSTVYVNFDL